MKKFIDPSAILYIIIIVVIVLLIGWASGSNTKNILVENSDIKITKNMNEDNQIVVIETSVGNIELALYKDKAPKTVDNFVKLARDGFYDNTKFHRVIKDFMIQGGDPYTKGEDTSVYGTGGPGYKFADEQNDLDMVRGVIAMANSGPNTNGSQFFIVTLGEASWLKGKHTIFGKVTSGMDVVDTIENTKTGERDIPVTPIIITRVVVK